MQYDNSDGEPAHRKTLTYKHEHATENATTCHPQLETELSPTLNMETADSPELVVPVSTDRDGDNRCYESLKSQTEAE
jgi:hypothetical protein